MVAFVLDEVTYALPLGAVVEVLPLVALFALPDATDTPEAVVGGLHLRGEIVAVVDVRVRLGLAAREPTLDTRIVVVEHAGRRVGLLVGDEVDVLPVADDGVGVLTTDGAPVVVLDPATLLDRAGQGVSP